MTAFDVARTLLQIVGLGALVVIAGLWWLNWRQNRARARYLESRSDCEGGEM